LSQEEPTTVSSPIVKRFDELTSAPSSAQERKRRREKLIDPEVLKSAAKNQAITIVQPAPSTPAHDFSVKAAAPHGYPAAPAWDAAAQRMSIAGTTPLPRSALSSPQTAMLFASPERVRKLSDEERR
jgi:hypothetical protein